MNADVAVIGAGPAGIQAGIHASRMKVSAVLIGKIENSAAFGTHIENHFGAFGKADGTELLKEGIEKAQRFGCSVIRENVVAAKKDGGGFILTTESGMNVAAKCIILASGTNRNRLGVPGEAEFFGKGVSYCASCDANFYKGKTAGVIGNESEAAASAELMTKYASKTYWFTKDTDVSEAMMKTAEDAGAEIVRSDVISINGSGNVASVTTDDGRTVELDGVFIELGGRSSADLAMDLGIVPDVSGTVAVDKECRTSVPGVFACGDVTGRPWQVSKAVGQGAVAGLNASDLARGRDVGR